MTELTFATTRFMESLDLQHWMRIGTMNPFSFVVPVFQPARRADSKVGVTAAGFMESLLSLLRMHRDHELISVGRARLRRALIFVAPKKFQGSTESRPTLMFMESPHSLLRTHWDHEPCLVAADVSRL